MKMGGLLLLLALIGLACSLTAQYFAAKAATGAATHLRNDLFAHIGGLSYTELDQVGSSTLITRMTSDINQVQNGINMTLRLLLRSPFVVFGAMVMAFTVDVKTAMVFAAAIPVLCVVVFGIMLVSMPLYKGVQRQLDRVLLTTRENLMGVRVIRAFNRQKSETDKFQGENDQLVRMQVFVGKISALLNPVTYVIINIGLVAVIWSGAGQVEAGVISQGKVIALVNYMSQILVELIKMANLIILISKAMACMNRVDGVFRVESCIRDGGGEAAPEKEKTLGENPMKAKSRNQEPGLRGSRKPEGLRSKGRVQEYEFCLRRRKGGGLKEYLLQGYGRSDHRCNRRHRGGKIHAGQHDSPVLRRHCRPGPHRRKGCEGLPLKSLREKVGLVPQRAVLFKGSLRDNMKWGKKDASDEEIYEALGVAQAREFVDGKDRGLELPIDQGGKNLSGGQRQRLTIARALVRKPEILIMDDSASALDFATDARLRAAVRENTENMTVFIVSQRPLPLKMQIPYLCWTRDIWQALEATGNC